MATGGNVPGRIPGAQGSDDLMNLKCQPCLEDGKLRNVAGMCIDCDENLCETCFNCHKVPKPTRHHKLIDREQMMQGHIRASAKDTCTEKCSYHDDDVIEYYCLTHCRLGCKACISLDHKSCDGVQHIPTVAKDLANNKEYRQTELRLKTTLDTFKTVSENVEINSAELESSCLKALNDIRDFRKKVNEAASKMETELTKKLLEIKSTELAEIAVIGRKYKATLEKLKSYMAKITTLQTAQQHCSSYIEMMRTKNRLVALYYEIKEAERDASCIKRQIEITPNQEILDIVTRAAKYGVLTESSRGSKEVVFNPDRQIVRAVHAQDINVKTETSCSITGITILSRSRLVLVDCHRATIMVVSVQRGQKLTSLALSSRSWGITAISSDTVAVTMPEEYKITMVTVGDNTMNIDRTLDVNGRCYGIDYRNDKLAISYCNPNKVQVLSMQGVVLHDISAALLYDPRYLTFGHDDFTLYVSINYDRNNVHVVHVELDGTVVATYTDNELLCPGQPVVDDNGEVLVCGQISQNVHQITSVCKKVRVLLSQADGLSKPCAICLSDKKDKMYVGNANNIKVYTLKRAAQ